MTARGSLRFPAKMRLRLDRDFQRVYAEKNRVDLGFIAVFAAGNDLAHARIGVSLPRKVGTAVQRNRIKRLLRESFRLGQHELPAGLDAVIVVRPHEPKPLKRYQESLASALHKLAGRGRKAAPDQIPNRPRDGSA